MATGLLPARRVGGMAAMAASPEARPSSDTGAITSISGSSPPRRSPVATGTPLGAGRSGSNSGSWRSCADIWFGSTCSIGSTPSADDIERSTSASAVSTASGWRGALRRDMKVS
jgi:hypothetical protein